MDFSSQENCCEVGESAYVSFKGATLDEPGGLGDSLLPGYLPRSLFMKPSVVEK